MDDTISDRDMFDVNWWRECCLRNYGQIEVITEFQRLSKKADELGFKLEAHGNIISIMCKDRTLCAIRVNHLDLVAVFLTGIEFEHRND